MKTIDVYGLGNGIVDVLVEVSEEEFQALGFEKGTMALLDSAKQAELIRQFSNKNLNLVSGGSVANSIVLFGQLGGRAAFSCRLGDDSYGKHYKSEFESLNIEIPGKLCAGGESGTSFIFITPDAERTMRTSLGVSAAFGNDEIDEDLVRQAQWIFIEGYLFCNPETGHGALNNVCELAKKYDTKIALTLSDAFVVNEFRPAVEHVVQQADLVFANDVEAQALAKIEDGEKAFQALQKDIPNLVVTLGGKGCMVKSGDFSGHIAPTKVDPTDLTGAGDAFAGSFLFGMVQELSPDTIAKQANYMAAQVIQKVGARLQGDAIEHWQKAIK